MGAVGFDSKGTFTRFVGWIKSTFSKVGHKHDGGDITSGAVPVSNGGTGATTPTDARTNLGLGNVENKSSATIRGELTKANVTSALGYTPPSSDKNTTYSLSQLASNGHKLTLTGSDGTSTTVLVPDTDTKELGKMTGTLGVAHGGTGASKAADARSNLGVTAENVVNGNAIAPSSVTATGAVSGSTVSDSVGSLADLRDSVSRYKDISVTTDSNGAIELSLDKSKRILGIYALSDNWVCFLPFSHPDRSYWQCIVVNFSMVPMANESMSLRVYYLE